MNRRNLAAVVALLAFAFLAPGILFAGDEATTTLHVKLSVRGMTCAGCVNGVKGMLEKVPGVTKAEVSLEKNEAQVTYMKGKTTPEEMIKAVEKLGFKASLQNEGKDAAKGA